MSMDCAVAGYSQMEPTQKEMDEFLNSLDEHIDTNIDMALIVHSKKGDFERLTKMCVLILYASLLWV